MTSTSDVKRRHLPQSGYAKGILPGRQGIWWCHDQWKQEVRAARQTGFKSRRADSGLLHTEMADSPTGKPSTKPQQPVTFWPERTWVPERLDFLDRFERIASLAVRAAAKRVIEGFSAVQAHQSLQVLPLSLMYETVTNADSARLFPIIPEFVQHDIHFRVR
jgi:hypothetical protein